MPHADRFASQCAEVIHRAGLDRLRRSLFRWEFAALEPEHHGDDDRRLAADLPARELQRLDAVDLLVVDERPYEVGVRKSAEAEIQMPSDATSQ
jgi:hypothetical protein